jgi:hypothetical protein
MLTNSIGEAIRTLDTASRMAMREADREGRAYDIFQDTAGWRVAPAHAGHPGVGLRLLRRVHPAGPRPSGVRLRDDRASGGRPRSFRPDPGAVVTGGHR